MAGWRFSSFLGVNSRRVARAGAGLTLACGFVLGVPSMASPAAATPGPGSPSSQVPFANPAQHHAVATRSGSRRAPLGAAPATASTPVHTFYPVAGALDSPQDPTYLGHGSCHSLDPGGTCTLRAAVMEADYEQAYIAIVLTSGTYPLAIPPASPTDASTGDLDITDSATVTITGPGMNRTTVDGTGMGDRIFQVEGNAVAHMTGFTVEHGDAAQGPYNTDPGRGGGIDISSGGAALVLKGVRIASSLAEGTTNDTGEGGGIYNRGSLWMGASQISGNVAQYSGGGLYNGSGSAQLIGDSLTGNTASHDGGGLENFYGPLTLQGGTVSGNQLSVPSYIYGEGGGLFVDDATTIVGTSITNNTIAPASGATGVTAQGGGIYAQYGLDRADHLTIRGNSISGQCACIDAGGGIFDFSGMTLTNSVVAGNTSDGSGGGIENQGDDEHLDRVTITGNKALMGNGGGIDASDVTHVTRATITGNSAAADGGGVWSDDGQEFDQSLIAANTALQGAGFYNRWVLQLTDDTVTENVASGTGNAGGGLYNSSVRGEGVAQLTNDTVSRNQSDDGGGIADYGNGTTVHNTIIAWNTANSGGTDTNCDVTSSGTVPLTDDGHNLDSGSTCGLTGPGDLSNTDPKLGALENNGGPTKTEALLRGSPAIDAGSSPAPSRDQRGVKRGTPPDMGAFENTGM